MRCPNCKWTEEIIIINLDGTYRIYLCHNAFSKEFGRIHADFFKCPDFAPLAAGV